MKAPAISFYEWQQRFSSEAACLEHLARLRWPEGFICPRCGHEQGDLLSARGLYECARCHYQSSVTAGTLFHATKLPLTKWFWAIYWVSSDKGSISALRLSKLVGVSVGARPIGCCASCGLPWDIGTACIGSVSSSNSMMPSWGAGGRESADVAPKGKGPILVGCED
jgi:hypothetical protein